MGPTTPSSAAGPVRGVIADDERLMRDQLKARLAEVWPELEIVGEAKNGLEAVELVGQHRPDVIFLDIRMPGLSGVFSPPPPPARPARACPPPAASPSCPGPARRRWWATIPPRRKTRRRTT